MRVMVRGGFWWCSLLLAAVLSVPCVGGEGSILNGIFNAACIIVLFPLIVSVGAGSAIHGEKGSRICNFLGEISYPLYITHYPLVYLQMGWVQSHPDASVSAHMPVRKWLKERF